MAQFEKVVARLDKGLNTNVMEKGVSLSGGRNRDWRWREDCWLRKKAIYF